MPEFNDPNKTLAENDTFSSTADSTQSTATQTNNTGVQEQPKNKNLKRILIIASAIVLLFVGLFAIYGLKLTSGLARSGRIKSQNSASNTLYKSITNSLDEMKENGYNVNGCYIICSDDKKDYNLPDNFSKEFFTDRLDYIFSDNKKLDWFAVIEQSEVTYIANSTSWKSDIIGLMPIYNDDSTSYAVEGPSHDYIHFYESRTIISDDEKTSITMLYDDAKDKVAQKAGK